MWGTLNSALAMFWDLIRVMPVALCPPNGSLSGTGSATGSHGGSVIIAASGKHNLQAPQAVAVPVASLASALAGLPAQCAPKCIVNSILDMFIKVQMEQCDDVFVQVAADSTMTTPSRSLGGVAKLSRRCWYDPTEDVPYGLFCSGYILPPPCLYDVLTSAIQGRVAPVVLRALQLLIASVQFIFSAVRRVAEFPSQAHSAPSPKLCQ